MDEAGRHAAELIPSAIINTALNEVARDPAFLKVMRKAGYEAMEAALASWVDLQAEDLVTR